MIHDRKRGGEPFNEIQEVTLTARLTEFLLATARRPIDRIQRSPLARPWTMTAGLLAANLVLAAVVVGSVLPAQAQGGPGTGFCQDCYQGYHPVTLEVVHATSWFDGVFGSRYGGSFATSHSSGAFYPGLCREAHRRVACCVPN
jgi:hypothetical protein